MNRLIPKIPWQTSTRWVFLIIVSVITFQSDSLILDQIDRTTTSHNFSIQKWVFINLPAKVFSRIKHTVINRGKEQEDFREQISTYFELEALIQWIKLDLSNSDEKLHSSSTLTKEYTNEQFHHISTLRHLELLIAQRASIEANVQTALEKSIHSILVEQGLLRDIGPFDFIFPPVYFQFDQLPKLLVISPRDEIFSSTTKLLSGKISAEDIAQIEKTIDNIDNHSSLVVDLGGLATYPSLMPHHPSIRRVLRTVAHEWMHQYWFFTPFGWNYFASNEMTSLNETAAELVGNILGDLAFKQLNLPISRPIATKQTNPGFDFNQTMRVTRKKVDIMLLNAEVEEAESYMENQRLLFLENGYHIRKLNQAFFAFHGTYAESPSSSSPIGAQLRRLWEIDPDIKNFVNTLSPISNYQDFKTYLKNVAPSKQ